ncbi:MAG: hypothetical protein ACE5OZ_26395 [Candidatus Heimdallarchaeota archaeon]
MTTTNLLKMSLLLVGLGAIFVLGLQTIAGRSILDEPMSTVNDWMMGHGDEDHHMEHHENEDHEEHHETHHDDDEAYDDDECH